MPNFYDIKVYTIISTGFDAMKNEVDPPSPEGKGSFSSIDAARAELKRLIALKKAKLDYRYDYEHQDDNYWEMFEGGNYHGCFARIEIIETTLHLCGEALAIDCTRRK